MDDKQSTKHKMYLNVKDTCTRNIAIWSGTPAFSKAYNEFKANIERIDKMNTQRQGTSKSQTENKNILKEVMANLTLEVVGALKAYASVTNNVILAKDLEITHSDIMRAKDTDADDMCLFMIGKSANHVAQLADYGITQANITKATEAISHFSEYIGKPKSAITEIKSLNEQNAALFKATDKILEEQMDNLMMLYKTSQAAFYSKYFSSRRIGGYTGGKKEEKVEK